MSLVRASKNGNGKKVLRKFLLLNKRTPYVVRGLSVYKVITTKFWKVARIGNVIVLRKFKKPISRTHINQASNINKVVIMVSWWNQDITPYWSFRKKQRNFRRDRVQTCFVYLKYDSVLYWYIVVISQNQPLKIILV